jgi:diguanylate cyclase (GGDEF)-like protein
MADAESGPTDAPGTLMAQTIETQIKEFCTAAGQPFSYDIFHNVYIWFGILWGLPIPLVTTSMHYAFLASHNIPSPLTTVLTTPIQWFFMIHPLLFGTLFGILGCVRREKERQVTALIDELQELSTHDPLTGLSNRRNFTRIFADELARISRRNADLSLIFADLDHFKFINDTRGHQVGDQVLKATATHLRACCRPYDTPARWGGEEFVILLPDTDEQAATLFAERIRTSLQAGLSPAISFPITISIGVAQHLDGESLDGLIERADRALYHAKQQGRNRVLRWRSIPPASR